MSGEQPARIALVPRPGRVPSIVVVWTAKAPQGTRLLFARSDDGGRSFGPAVPVPGSDASGNRGWESIAVDRDGRVVAVWLDHRETAAGQTSAREMNHAGHQHGASGEQRADGVARAQLSKLFFGRLDDPASAQSLTGGVCYCCKTSVAAGSDGSVYAAWRHVYPGNVRDIAFTMSADGGRTFAAPVRVSDDNWVLDGCPENGPALAVDGGRRVHVVWPTLVPGPSAEERAHAGALLRHVTRWPPLHRAPVHSDRGCSASSADRARTRGARRSWSGTSRRPASGAIALARGRSDGGVARFVRAAIGDGLPAAYPVVTSVEGATIVSWVSGSGAATTIHVERLPE